VALLQLQVELGEAAIADAINAALLAPGGARFSGHRRDSPNRQRRRRPQLIALVMVAIGVTAYAWSKAAALPKDCRARDRLRFR